MADQTVSFSETIATSINQFQFIYQVTAKAVTWQGVSEKTMQLPSPLPPPQASTNLHCTKEIIAQFTIQQKYSKKQDQASKYTGIHTSSPSPFSITSSDIDV